MSPKLLMIALGDGESSNDQAQLPATPKECKKLLNQSLVLTNKTVCDDVARKHL